MTTTSDVRAVFSDSGWEEQPYAGTDGVKLARVRFQRAYRGDIEGTSRTELLMVYRTDGSVTFVGLEHFEGRILGRTGTVVLHSDGEYREGAAESRGKVVPGTGTGELRTLEGTAPSRAVHAPENAVVFQLAFG